MPLLVTHRSRSCVAAVDHHHQKLYGRFHYDQYPLDMSKCNNSSSTFANGRNDDDDIEEELHDKKQQHRLDEGK